MKNEKGQFIKGHKPTEIESKKISKALKAQWKRRPNYHGMYHSKFHNTWRSMKGRCNGNSKSGKIKYHDRGITYEKKWETFAGFYDDMFPSYIEGRQLDRIKNDLGYTKDNCRWVTPKENANNKRNNIRVTINGNEMTLSQWADFFNMPFRLVKCRYYRKFKTGKSKIEDIFIKRKQ